MEDFIGIIVLVITVGLMCVGIVTITGTDTSSLLIHECEKTLPRTQHCKLVAVPEEIKQ